MFVEGEQSEARYFRIPKDVGGRIRRGLLGSTGDRPAIFDDVITALQQEDQLKIDERKGRYLSSMAEANDASRKIHNALPEGRVAVVSDGNVDDVVVLPETTHPLETLPEQPEPEDIAHAAQALQHRVNTNLAIINANAGAIARSSELPIVRDASEQIQSITGEVTKHVDEVVAELNEERIIAEQRTQEE